jgi:uncharacterized protein with PIN domain
MTAQVLPFAKPEAPRCPECGGQLDIIKDGSILEQYHPGIHNVTRQPNLPYRERFVPFAACTGCEFCIEIVTS